ncbi:uncharacterized protein LOC135146117 [Zophobas morio]|uniref:uncharacterized protein LOC135146117 n=1 Tax=Zophobas morio TaxID=2755281 RepID=UPI0030832259
MSESSPASVKSAQLRRHQEHLLSLSREFQTTRTAVSNQKTRNFLVGDARREISEYKNPVEYYSIENARVIDIQKEAEENLNAASSLYGQLLGESERLQSNQSSLRKITEFIFHVKKMFQE